MKIQIGDLVRLKKIGGPKMLVGAVVEKVVGVPVVHLFWFDKHDQFQTIIVNVELIEKCRETAR